MPGNPFIPSRRRQKLKRTVLAVILISLALLYGLVVFLVITRGDRSESPHAAEDPGEDVAGAFSGNDADPDTSGLLAADDIYLMAREKHTAYWTDHTDSEALYDAISLYRRVLERDPEHARSYAGLAMAACDEHDRDPVLPEGLPDSILRLTRFALTYDPSLGEAYYVRGLCYLKLGEAEKALNNLDRALEMNPYDFRAYRLRSYVYIHLLSDHSYGCPDTTFLIY